MKAVIDTNVLVSALLFRGISSKIHMLWKSGAVQPIFSREILAEYARTLSYRKFHLTPEEIASLLDEEILPFFTLIKPGRVRLTKRPVDPDDEPFVKTASCGGVDVLISGDRHLLALSGVYRFKILPPAEFLEIFGKSSSGKD